jgi:two-component system sensor histidine kinase KdpD
VLVTTKRGAARLALSARWFAGTLVALGGIGALSAVMVPVRAHISVATAALVLVVPVVASVAVGGIVSGAVAVTAGFIAFDVLFIPPYGTLEVGAGEDWTALGVYAVVMLIVARVVAYLQRARLEARRNEDATRRLYEVSDLLIGDQPVAGVLQAIATTMHAAFSAGWVAVLIPSTSLGARGDPALPLEGELAVAATSGTVPEEDLARLVPLPGRPESLHWSAGAPRDGVVRVALTARGRPIGIVALSAPGLDRHHAELVQTYANHAALALERSQLREQALRTELLEQVDALRASLMGAVSHDLRTPLASVKAAVSALRDADRGRPLASEDRRELLALIETQSDALDRLVANLLDMTRIQSGALELRKELALVTDVVDRAIRAAALDPGRFGVDLPDDLPPVDVDVVLMEQVLANLFDNAVRHSPDGASIEVAARAGEDVVELSVRDHGPGVPPEDRERVFTMFSRIGAEGRAGLGLAIAKAFVEAHGQTIRVEDAPGGGARFVVTLPVAVVPVGV